MTRHFKHAPIALTIALVVTLGVAAGLMTQEVSDTSRRLQIAQAEQRTTAMRNVLAQISDIDVAAIDQFEAHSPVWSHQPGLPETSARLAGLVPTEFQAVALFDKKGTLLGSAGSEPLVLRPDSPGFAAFWSNAASRGFNTWQVFSPPNGIPLVARAAASKSDSRVVYVRSQPLRVTGITEVMRGYTMGTQGTFALTDATGRVLGSSVAGQEGKELAPSIRAAAHANRSDASFMEIDGTPSVVVVREIDPVGLAVVYYQDTKSLLGNIDSVGRRVRMLVVSLIVVALLAMGAVWFRRQRAVEESAERLTELVANVSDAVLVLRGEEVVFASPGAEALLAMSPEDMMGLRLQGLIGPTGGQILTQLVATTKGRQRPITVGDVPCVAHDGRTLWVEATVADRSHSRSIRGTVISLHDITERRQRSEELMHEATHDRLTGLANRSNFAVAVEKTIARSRRDSSPFAVLYLDLDGFKAVNDVHGHAGGDLVLCEIAARLNVVIRGCDLPARLGGDEFAVLLSEVNGADEARRVAMRLITEINRPISSPQGPLHVGVSIGIAMADETDDYASIIRDADLAMYEAKESGKNTFRLVQSRSESSVPVPRTGEGPADFVSLNQK